MRSGGGNAASSNCVRIEELTREEKDEKAVC